MEKSIRMCGKTFSVLAAAVLFIAAGGTARGLADEGLKKVSDGVYAYCDVKGSSPGNSFGANAGIIIGRDGILVVDTLISSNAAKKFIRDIRAVSDKPIKYVVNTHWHLDHTFGNSEFAALGAVIISHRNCKANMEKYGESVLKDAKSYGLSEADMAGTGLAYPSITFTDRMELDLGDKEVELVYAGPSHTDGSILVCLPKQKVAFAGDLLFTGYHAFLAEGDIDSWAKAIDALAAMDMEVIVPGHGPVSGKKDLYEMKDYLAVFDKKAVELSRNSRDIEYIASEIKKALPGRAEGDWLIRANIQMKYLKAE